MVRWVIKADGRIVAAEYSSEQNAWIYAGYYEEHCLYQDEPFAPKMTVEKEEIE